MNTTELKNKLTKSLEFLKNELNQVRTGRASPAMIEEIKVEAYGSFMTIRELASITLLDTQNLVISPWDKSIKSSIAKAIRDSGTGLNPVDDADRLRVPVPSLTEDRRKEYTKVVTTKVEEAKNTMRQTRQDSMKDIDKQFIEKEISEDEKFKLKEDVEKIVKDFVSQADALGENKKQELMTI